MAATLQIEREPTTQVAPAPEPENDASELDQWVDEAGLDSFPASDPPSWWAGTIVGRSPDPRP